MILGLFWARRVLPVYSGSFRSVGHLTYEVETTWLLSNISFFSLIHSIKWSKIYRDKKNILGSYS